MFALIALVLLGGCATPRPPAGPANPSCDLQRFVRNDVFSSYFQAVRLVGGDKKPPSLNVLALSAGGEFGAYGAGVLVGWGKVGQVAQPSPRRDIQIVTGVSTGAILATHAFLGLDTEIEQAYLGSSGKIIYKQRSLLSLLWSNSLLDASGKAALIQDYLTNEVIERVASERSGRGLFVGVVDADTGKFLRIDMVALAKGLSPRDGRNDCYRAVINASSAIPIAFQPQFIDGRMFVDGGARRHLFLTELPSDAMTPGQVRRLFGFVHGDLRVEDGKVDNHVLKIAGRLSELVTEQGMRDSIQIADLLARQPVAARGPDGSLGSSTVPLFQTFFAAAAKAAGTCAPKKQECRNERGLLSEDMFCQPFMKCLASEGRLDGEAYGRGERPWPQWTDLRQQQVAPEAPQPLRKLIQ